MKSSQSLAASLRTAVSSLHKGLRRHMGTISSYSMTEVETIACLVREGSLLPTDLAARTHVKTQSMSQILKKLEDEGIIKRTPSKQDKRKVFISLTPKGKKIVEEIKYERDEWLQKVIEDLLSEKEKKQLAAALPAIMKLAVAK